MLVLLSFADPPLKIMKTKCRKNKSCINITERRFSATATRSLTQLLRTRSCAKFIHRESFILMIFVHFS